MIVLNDIKIPVPAFLAPMSGVTDAPFRRQASKFGVPIVVTEMIAGSELLSNRKDMMWRIEKHEQAGPFIVQLAGRNPTLMRLASELATEKGADVIDINMGCPSRLVTGGQSGSALMRDLNLAKSLIIATRQGTNKPITLKMRLGWDNDTLNAPELAKIAEDEGVKLLTVHGRTRCQFYNGKADWKKVRCVKEVTSLPVIVNGDIDSVRSAKKALSESSADGIMAGRSVIGRPWLLGEIAAKLWGCSFALPKWEAKITSFIEQAEDSIALYGPHLGIRVVRKHISAFVEHAYVDAMHPNDVKKLKKALCTYTTIESLSEALLLLSPPDMTYSKREIVPC